MVFQSCTFQPKAGTSNRWLDRSETWKVDQSFKPVEFWFSALSLQELFLQGQYLQCKSELSSKGKYSKRKTIFLAHSSLNVEKNFPVLCTSIFNWNVWLVSQEEQIWNFKDILDTQKNDNFEKNNKFYLWTFKPFTEWSFMRNPITKINKLLFIWKTNAQNVGTFFSPYAISSSS